MFGKKQKKSPEELAKEREERLASTADKLRAQMITMDAQKNKLFKTMLDARRQGLKPQEEQARGLMRRCLATQKQVSGMLMTLELAVQSRDIAVLGRQFMECIGAISEDITVSEEKTNVKKTQQKYLKAMYSSGKQAEKIDEFIAMGDYASAVERLGGVCVPEGDFVSPDGSVIGRHRGIIRYTVGQHKGLGGNYPERMFVLKIDAEKNTVTLGTEDLLFSRELTASRFNWICGEPPSGGISCLGRIRYRHREQPAKAYPLSDGRVRVVFDEPQRAITPGQSVVLYDGDEVLGGGIID